MTDFILHVREDGSREISFPLELSDGDRQVADLLLDLAERHGGRLPTDRSVLKEEERKALLLVDFHLANESESDGFMQYLEAELKDRWQGVVGIGDGAAGR